MQYGPVEDDARSVESPVREAADGARRSVEPPVRAADQEYQDTLYSESEVQHCIEQTDKKHYGHTGMYRNASNVAWHRPKGLSSHLTHAEL